MAGGVNTITVGGVFTHALGAGHFPMNSTGRWYLAPYRGQSSRGQMVHFPNGPASGEKAAGNGAGAPFQNQEKTLRVHSFLDFLNRPFDKSKSPIAGTAS
jgi:hypothetical protein